MRASGLTSRCASWIARRLEQRRRSRDPDVLASKPQPWIRQALACLLLFLLSSRLPMHLAVLVAALRQPAADLLHSPPGALAMVALDGFGVLCALYLCHSRLVGVRLWRCYPPQRLIPLSLHFIGLLCGLLNLATTGGSGI